MIRIRPLGVLSLSGRTWGKYFPPNTSWTVGRNPKPQCRGRVRVAGAHCCPLGLPWRPRSRAGSLSVVEKRATNHERVPRHAADEADKSAQGILEVFGHGRYATLLRDTIVCL